VLVSSNWWINWLLQLCYSLDLKLPIITGSVLFSICLLFEYEFVKLKLWKIAKFRIKFKWSAKEEIRIDKLCSVLYNCRVLYNNCC